jgi:3-keto-5-aminohexanoate cleavage enzyme
VISCSINGARKKEDNPFVPVGHDEIARTAIACLDAGASVIHAHNTDFTLTGREAAEDYLKSWRQVMAQRPGALWYPTLSAKFGSDLTHIEVLDDEIDLAFGCIDPGAVPFGRLDEQGLPVGFIYSTGFDEIRAAFAMFSRRRLGVQIAIYEPNFLRTTLAYHAAGKLPEGTVVNLYFGGPHGAGGGAQGMSFGLPPTRTALDAYLEMLGDADLAVDGIRMGRRHLRERAAATGDRARRPCPGGAGELFRPRPPCLQRRAGRKGRGAGQGGGTTRCRSRCDLACLAGADAGNGCPRRCMIVRLAGLWSAQRAAMAPEGAMNQHRSRITRFGLDNRRVSRGRMSWPQSRR